MCSVAIDRTTVSSDAARELPQKLRHAREAKRLSVRALAKQVGISPSQVSAIELGKSQPSAATLYAIAAELDLSIDELVFGSSRPPGRQEASSNGSPPYPQAAPTGAATEPILRAADRAEITLDTGVVWQRLTPGTEPGVEFLHTIYDVGCSSGKDHAMARHSGHEWGVVLSGRLEVQIGFDQYELGPGDSISFESMTPHLFRNVGDEPVHTIWFVLGRERGPARMELARDYEDEPLH
jgi:transcriptional regulator with XRE-family HTH domain